jgi:hypothetical protein
MNSRNLALSALLLIATFAFASESDGKLPVANPTPTGFTKTMMIMGNSERFDEFDEFMPDAIEDFQKAVRGRTDEEIEAFRLEALDYFKNIAGIDFADPETAQRWLLMPFYTDPRAGIKCYTISGERTPADGWPVHDGGWRVILADPAGSVLGGEYDGVEVPFLTTFVYAEYVIERDKTGLYPIFKNNHGVANKDQHEGGDFNILIPYRTDVPIFFNDAEVFVIRFNLYHPEYGVGIAQGMNAPKKFEDGTLETNTRLIFSFTGEE